MHYTVSIFRQAAMARWQHLIGSFAWRSCCTRSEDSCSRYGLKSSFTLANNVAALASTLSGDLCIRDTQLISYRGYTPVRSKCRFFIDYSIDSGIWCNHSMLLVRDVQQYPHVLLKTQNQLQMERMHAQHRNQTRLSNMPNLMRERLFETMWAYILIRIHQRPDEL